MSSVLRVNYSVRIHVVICISPQLTINLFESVTVNITSSKLLEGTYALRGVVVSTHTCIWFTMYYSCIWQTRVYTNETHKMCHTCLCKLKCTSAVRANKNAPVYIVRANQRCTRIVRANHAAHGSTLTSRVYMQALNVHFYIIDLSYICTCIGYFACIFRNVSSNDHVIA